MQTHISHEFKNNQAIERAEKILRSCVHCGFCTATCPTYQLLGDELDSPRGRIYLIKQMLEGNEVTAKTQLHLDRCLSCSSCETTCPSGVEYAHLLETGRELVAEKVTRSVFDRLQRRVLQNLLPYKKRFGFALGLGRLLRPVLPGRVKKLIPGHYGNRHWSTQPQSRKMLILDGCVQPALSPQINAATSRVLARLGIELINLPQAQCCGAVNQHMNDSNTAQHFIKQNIDSWYPLITSGEAEVIVITASGCGAMIKEYGYLLQDDADYAEKAKVISDACKDLSEVIATENISTLSVSHAPRVAFHAPCTLQHGQKLPGIVEDILQQTGHLLTPVSDAHLCCGSAGTYSILQAEISQQLKHNKLDSLQAGEPDIIATANIGCLHHLASDSNIKVVHWIELLDQGK